MEFTPKSTDMTAKEFQAWKAKKMADGKWQGGDTPDAKYAKPDAKVSPSNARFI